MIVRHFLQWVRTAPAGERAEATSALARAFLYSDLSSDDLGAADDCPVCGNNGHLRPHVVWVGEAPLSIARVYEALAHCRLFMVIGIADGYRGEAAKAFVKLRSGAPPLTLDALRDFLADKIGRHEMPAALEIRPALPRTSVGKYDKKTIRSRHAEAAYDVTEVRD